MKTISELYRILAKDIQGEAFTKREKVIFGIAAPLALVAACLLAELL